MGPGEVVILNPHGFCAGVTGALRKALSLLGDPSRNPAVPVYCLHEIVHNEIVVGALRDRGMVFTDSLSGVPEGLTVLFSAHGVGPAVRREAAMRRLRVVDATCPFVTRVHTAARSFASRGLPVVVIGHAAHAEVRGILGEIEDVAGSAAVVSSPDDCSTPPLDGWGRIGVVSQTTMNSDDVRSIVEELGRRHAVETTAETCRATKERQDAARAFDGDALLVLGSANSSNTRRLCEVARTPRVFRAAAIEEVRAIDFSDVRRLGVTSGASTPEDFFNEVVAFLRGGAK